MDFDFNEDQAAIGAERLAALADWSRSTADWKELFA